MENVLHDLLYGVLSGVGLAFGLMSQAPRARSSTDQFHRDGSALIAGAAVGVLVAVVV